MMSYFNWSRIKHIASVVLLVCMFLPLSQCEIQPPPNKPDQVVKVEINQALQTTMMEGLSWQNSAVAILFIAPFFFSFLVLLRRDINQRLGEPLQTSWFLGTLEFLSAIALGVLLSFHAYLGAPLYGLYLSAAMVLMYLVAWASELMSLKRIST